MFERNNDSLTFDTSIPLTDGSIEKISWEFSYFAYARGGNYEFIDIKVIVIVCGYEVIDI